MTDYRLLQEQQDKVDKEIKEIKQWVSKEKMTEW